MTKGIVVECPKGVYTRIMPGSKAMELYEESKKPGGNKGTKQKPSAADQFVAHMNMLHTTYLKEIGNVRN